MWSLWAMQFFCLRFARLWDSHCVKSGSTSLSIVICSGWDLTVKRYIVSPCFWMTGFQANLWLRWSREGSLIMWFILWRISVCFNCFNFFFGNHSSIRSTRKTQELVMFPWTHVWAGIVGRSFFQIPGRRSRRFRTLDSACTDHSFSHNGKTGYVRRVVWIVEKDVLSNVGDAFVQWVSF